MSVAVAVAADLNTIIDSASSLCPKLDPRLIMALHSELVTNQAEPNIFCALLAGLNSLSQRKGLVFPPSLSTPIFFWVHDATGNPVQTSQMQQTGLDFSRFWYKNQTHIAALNTQILNGQGRHLMAMPWKDHPARSTSAMIVTVSTGGLHAKQNMGFSTEAGSRMNTNAEIPLIDNFDGIKLGDRETEQSNLWRLIEDLQSVVAP